MTSAVMWAPLQGEMFKSPITSGFMAVSDASAGLLVVVYGHSEGFREVCHTGPLDDTSQIETQIILCM